MYKYTRAGLIDNQFRYFIKILLGRNENCLKSKEFKNLNTDLYNSYIHSLENNLISNPRSFWPFYNATRSASSISEYMNYKDLEFDSISGIVSSFSDYFS